MVTQQYKNRFDNGCMMMKGTQKIFSPLIFKPAFCLLFICLASVSAFGQISGLLLTQEDIRLEFDFLDGETGYSLFIRKKQGVESVMLTEPAGFHALRSLRWNVINGNEKRTLSGRVLSDANSSFSIVSSTPLSDRQFGSAFQLFMPMRVVYGNPSSHTGTVFLDINEDIQINIRTFDHKFADPNTGKFQNNQYFLTSIINTDDREQASPPFHPVSSASTYTDFDNLKSELRKIQIRSRFLDTSTEHELREFLHEVFWNKDNEQQ